MPLMREKRVHVLGVDVTVAMDAARAEALAHSALWQKVARPSLQMVRRRAGSLRGATNGHADGAAHQETNGRATFTTTRGVDGATLSLVPQAPRVQAAGDDPQAAALRERVKDI